MTSIPAWLQLAAAVVIVASGLGGLVLWSRPRVNRLHGRLVRARLEARRRGQRDTESRWLDRETLDAEGEGYAVVTAHRQWSGGTVARWSGACPDETLHIPDHQRYVHAMQSRTVPPTKTFWGPPPKIGTRRSCARC
jgi:hypothetical protein